jgi:hypothetical protein
METLHTLEWGHLEIDKVAYLKGMGSMSGVCVALLSGLSGFQTVMDQLYLFFGFVDDVRSKHLAFSSFRPVERGTTLAAI